MAKKTVEEMVGEFLRAVGELVFVFAILDKIIKGDITPWWTVTAAAVGLAFFFAGCYVERRRR